jgi:flagellar motor protein MotB
MLTGCVVWKNDYDKLQVQNQQLQQQVAADQQQIIANLAKKLAPTQQNKIMVSGCTDNAPIGPALKPEGGTSNQELS